jgi:excisionase family DNA binding protein
MVAATTDTDEPRLGYSPAEFAAAFGCTRQHVQNLIARGELPSIKLGRLRRIPASVVAALIEGGAGDDRVA